jgi:subtilisin family serine protease
MKRTLYLILVIALLVAFLPASVSAQATPKAYLLISATNTLPARLAASVAKAGGVLVRSIPEVGVAVAESADANFKAKASKISGLRSVVPDVNLQWISPNEQVELAEDYGNPPTSGDDDFYFNLQWGHDAVNAPEAWNNDWRGAGVRVAVLDSGIDATHPDLATQVNMELSTSFVPGETVQVRPQPQDPTQRYFSHGTHTAGTIAAADNGFGVIGIAPEAEIVAVKVLSEYTGSGDFDWVISGIVYAADIDADIINMSLGAALLKSGFCDEEGCVTAREVSELRVALGRATTYAYQQGVTIFASEGNEAIDKDHTANFVTLPADSPHVISISATAPVGWAVDPSVSLDNLASYSNYGASAVDFAAPGGDFLYYFVNPTQLCTVAGLTRPCYVFDYVFSTNTGGWSWAAGTSMAAPHAAGVAALIIGANGGEMSPAAVEAAMRAYAEDLGKPGNDAFYGKGRVHTGFYPE